MSKISKMREGKINPMEVTPKFLTTVIRKWVKENDWWAIAKTLPWITVAEAFDVAQGTHRVGVSSEYSGRFIIELDPTYHKDKPLEDI